MLAATREEADVAVLIDTDDIVGRRCCGNCLEAKIVPDTEASEWRCRQRAMVGRRGGKVATKTGRASGSLRSPRGCRQYSSMGR